MLSSSYASRGVVSPLFEHCFKVSLSKYRPLLTELEFNILWNIIFFISIINLIFTKVPGFPGGSDGKESACNAEDQGLIPRSGRPIREGTGNPLQYDCPGNPMDRGAWQATAHGVTKSQTWLSNSFSFQFLPNIAKLRPICLQNKPGLNKLGLMIYINYNWCYRPVLLCWNFYRVSDWTFTRLLRARKVMPRACHRYHLTDQGEFLPFQGRQHTLRFLYLLVSLPS